VDIGTTMPGRSLGLRIMNNHDVTIEEGTVSLNREPPDAGLHEVSYIGAIPTNVTIDGAFADWQGKTIRNDEAGDVNREDMDILRYGLSTAEDGPAFYLRVDGEITHGKEVPYWNSISESDPIVEDDSLKTGEDVVHIFIDTLNDTGYSVGAFLGADYLIEVRGRYNQVLSNALYEWSGNNSLDWNWQEIGSVEVALDYCQMEITLEWQDIGVDPTMDQFSVFFQISDWQTTSTDYSDGEGVLVGPTR
ncbi:MAG: hypothetical protein JSW28_09720, partial [Thermoplasmata archaeon]